MSALQRDAVRIKRTPARSGEAGGASGAVVKSHVCHSDRFLPRRLEPVFTALASNIAEYDYKLAQRLALFIVAVDSEIGTATLRRLVRKVVRL